MTDDDDDVVFDEEFKPDALLCFERENSTQMPPIGFTSQTLRFNLTPDASLDFTDEIASLHSLIHSGYKIVFDLDFGLFQPGWKGFLHQGYFQSCLFACTHFATTVLPLFQDNCLGAIICRLDLPCSKLDPHASSDGSTSEEFYSEMTSQYLSLLCEPLPHSLAKIILVAADGVQNPAQFSQCVINDCFEGFWLAIRNAPIHSSWGVWDSKSTNRGFIGKNLPQPSSPPSKALMYPTNRVGDTSAAFNHMQNLNGDYKIIREEALTLEWDGIDELFVPDHPYASATKRALAGFQAAGGKVVLIPAIKIIAVSND